MNLRAAELLIGHAKVKGTVRYLGIAVDDVLEMEETQRHEAAEASRPT